MARVMVPTMRARVDPNPRGSATSHVTLPSANPMEREVTSLRPANQPRGMQVTQMPSGLGSSFAEDFQSGFTGEAPAADASGNPVDAGASSGGGGTGTPWWQKITGALVEGVGVPLLREKVLDSPQPQRLPTRGQQPVPTGPGSHQLPAAGPATLPNANPTKPLPVGVPGAMPAPGGAMPAPGGASNIVPWIVGGAAVLGVGAILLTRKPKAKRRSKRRRRR